MEFTNAYADAKCAESYSRLELTGTYYLAYRDLPEIIRRHAEGNRALDFGCGAGRSTRFLRGLGFVADGIDISENMIRKAMEIDPEGSYRHIIDGDYSPLEQRYYDLILAMFTFDNIPREEKRQLLLKGLKNLLNRSGKIILLDSTPDIYLNEWVSFSTKDFPENRLAGSGDKVRTIITDSTDRRPVDDILWFNHDYLRLFESTGLQLLETRLPLGKQEEPYKWINETTIPPWVIYVLGSKA